MKRPTLILITLLFPASLQLHAETDHVVIDRFVPHVSTVPANKGENVGLFLHEKLGRETHDAINAGNNLAGRVVLFVHGNSVSSVPDFDLPYKDYSWMAYLADAGFDTFAMDHTGYGYSPRPAMDNPCNMSEANQQVLIPHALDATCEPEYTSRLTTAQSDWDEIDTMVEFIRELRGVDKVSLISWSWGGIRAGGYAARFPYKIDKLILFAPGYSRDEPSTAPEELPSAGVPMTLQSYTGLMETRWRRVVACDDQIDPGIQPVLWESIMAYEQLGYAWHPQGIMRYRLGDYWGWNKEFAAKVTAPTLILIGEQDFLVRNANDLYPDLKGTDNKVLALMECATHFAVWEKTQYRFLQEASLEWLRHGTVQGTSQGTLNIKAAR